jgi:hypothetical protein
MPEGVLGVSHRPEEPVAVRLDLMAVRADQLLECGLVARPGPFDQLGAHLSVLPSPDPRFYIALVGTSEDLSKYEGTDHRELPGVFS